MVKLVSIDVTVNTEKAIAKVQALSRECQRATASFERFKAAAGRFKEAANHQTCLYCGLERPIWMAQCWDGWQGCGAPLERKEEEAEPIPEGVLDVSDFCCAETFPGYTQEFLDKYGIIPYEEAYCPIVAERD